MMIQNLMSIISLICFMYVNVFEGNTHKHILTGVDTAPRYKIKVATVLEAIYKKGSVFKFPKVFTHDRV